MMTTPLEAVIAQNMVTVAFIQCGDLPSALNSSIVALETNKVFDSTNNESATPQSSTGSSVDECMYHSNIETSALDVSSRRYQLMYDQGIHIPPEVNDSSTITTILVFNAALVHHLLAKSNPHHHTLQRAAHNLYELAYKSYKDMDKNVLFQFVVINNIAVILRNSGSIEASNQCFDYLMSLYMLFLVRGDHLQLRHVQGFVANIPLPTETMAAAA